MVVHHLDQDLDDPISFSKLNRVAEQVQQHLLESSLIRIDDKVLVEATE